MADRGLRTGVWVFVGLFVIVSVVFVHVSGNFAFAENAAAEATEAEADWVWQELGEAVFTKNCAACHGMTGEGIPGVFPAFKGNEFVVGEPLAVIRVPMNGRGGMPRFGDVLSDEELAAVLSHIRNSWGNEAEPITPAMVAQVRSER